MKNSFNRPIVFWDCETTGLSPTDSRVVEIAAVKVDPNGEIYTYSQLLNPGFDTTGLQAMEINKIAQEDLNKAPAFSDCADIFLNFVSDAGLLVAHNAPFDVDFMSAELQRARAALPLTRVVDSIALARSALFMRSGFALQSLKSMLLPNASYGSAHRALADCMLLKDIFFILLQRKFADNPVSMDAIYQVGRSARQFRDTVFAPLLHQGDIAAVLTKEAASVNAVIKGVEQTVRGRPAAHVRGQSGGPYIVIDVESRPVGIPIASVRSAVGVD